MGFKNIIRKGISKYKDYTSYESQQARLDKQIEIAKRNSELAKKRAELSNIQASYQPQRQSGQSSFGIGTGGVDNVFNLLGLSQSQPKKKGKQSNPFEYRVF